MDLIDRLTEIAIRTPKILNRLDTEESTKNALVMPFIIALGYNVFDPHEVIPEFTADVGVKKGEKVDYAIIRDGKPIILIECKAATADLNKEHASQLFRYFTVTEARFGILTNGLTYKVYSDLEAPNKMDSRPFLEFSALEVSDELACQLKMFAKESFDLEGILSNASELKYMKGIKRYLMEEWMNPTDEFVKLLASRVYQGRMTQSTKEQFTEIVKKGFHNFVNDRINERLKSALNVSDPVSISVTDIPDASLTDTESECGKIITTEDELEGYYVVKSIVREIVDPKRVYIRDTQSYCGVLLDDNNRRPICRLHFNAAQKYIGIFNNEKIETRHTIENVNQIYKYADELKQTVSQYDKTNSETIDSPST